MRNALVVGTLVFVGCTSSVDGSGPPAPPPPVVPVFHPSSTRTIPRGERPPPSLDGAWLWRGGVVLATFQRIEDHGRWKVACTFDVDREVHLCVTDVLDEKWTKGRVGTRLFTIDRDFRITEELVSEDLFSSYLWGDFDGDGHPDFIGFRDTEEIWEPASQPPVMLFSNARGPGRALPFTDPSKAGAVLDANDDGCADVLVLGTGIEKDLEKGDVTYFDDALLLGDCKGGFAKGTWPTTPGGPKPGRTAAVTELNGDGCVDIVVGNYRGFANDVMMGDCHGDFVHDPSHPATGVKKNGGFYGHTVALVPYDFSGRGVLDLAVANVWHPDERGNFTDESHVLVNGSKVRTPMPYFLEAPFGFWIGDLDQDGEADWFFATGSRWGEYKGRTTLTWRGADPFDQTYVLKEGQMRMREAPAAIDIDFDGCADWVGDARIVMNVSSCNRSIGFVFEERGVVASGLIARVTFDDGSLQAFALGNANEMAVSLGKTRKAATLEVAGRTFDVAGFEPDRYHVVTLER